MLPRRAKTSPLRLLMVTLLAGLLVQPAWGQGRPPPRGPAPTAPAPAPIAGDVDVQVMVVHGTDTHSRIDARLKSILQYLKFMNHTGYSLLSEDDHELAEGQHHTFPVVGNRRIDVELISRDAKQARIRIRMFSGKAKTVETVIAVHRNKSFIISGPKHDGGELILAFTAKY